MTENHGDSAVPSELDVCVCPPDVQDIELYYTQGPSPESDCRNGTLDTVKLGDNPRCLNCRKIVPLAFYDTQEEQSMENNYDSKASLEFMATDQELKRAVRDLTKILGLCALANALTAWAYCIRHNLSFHEAWAQQLSSEAVFLTLVVDVLMVFLHMRKLGYVEMLKKTRTSRFRLAEVPRALHALCNDSVTTHHSQESLAGLYEDSASTIAKLKKMCPPDPCPSACKTQRRIDSSKYRTDLYAGSTNYKIQERMKKVVDMEKSRNNAVLPRTVMDRLIRIKQVRDNVGFTSTEEEYAKIESVTAGGKTVRGFHRRASLDMDSMGKKMITHTDTFNYSSLPRRHSLPHTGSGLTTSKQSCLGHARLIYRKEALIFSVAIMAAILFVPTFRRWFLEKLNDFITFLKTDEGKVCVVLAILLALRIISTDHAQTHGSLSQALAVTRHKSIRYVEMLDNLRNFVKGHKTEIIVHCTIAFCSLIFAQYLQEQFKAMWDLLNALVAALITWQDIVTLFNALEGIFSTDLGKIAVVFLILFIVSRLNSTSGISTEDVLSRSMLTLMGDSKETIKISYEETLSEDRYWKQRRHRENHNL